MRSWTYSYKTSDGFRHEGEMFASSKDEVYSELRKRGIRAIRVDERIVPIVRRGLRGLRKRDWFLIVAVVVVLLAMGVAFLPRPVEKSSGADAPIDSSASTEAELASFNPVFQKILSDADSIRLQRNRELSYVDRSLVRNYALIAHMKDLRELRVQIQRGRNIVASSRDKFKKAFGEQYGQLTDDQAAVREEAQRFYAGVMEEYDAQEESLDGDECTLDLLEGNRDGWKVHNGKIIWIDPRLERSFRLFSRVAQ